MLIRQLLIIPFLLVSTIDSTQIFKLDTNVPNKIIERQINNQKRKNMGISINLYRVKKAEKFEELKDLESQISITSDTRVNLYKMTGDLAVIFLNSTNPHSDQNTIPYKMLYGREVHQSVSVGEIGGFLSSSEILEITKWIKNNKVETFEGFSKMYDGLSIEVKKELEEMGTDDKIFLYNAYVKPLAVLYFTALENQNSVIFIGQ